MTEPLSYLEGMVLQSHMIQPKCELRHFMYSEHVKSYADTAGHLRSLLCIVDMFGHDIRMKFD